MHSTYTARQELPFLHPSIPNQSLIFLPPTSSTQARRSRLLSANMPSRLEALSLKASFPHLSLSGGKSSDKLSITHPDPRKSILKPGSRVGTGRGHKNSPHSTPAEPWSIQGSKVPRHHTLSHYNTNDCDELCNHGMRIEREAVHARKRQTPCTSAPQQHGNQQHRASQKHNDEAKSLACCKDFPRGEHHMLCPNYDEMHGQQGGLRGKWSQGYARRSIVGLMSLSDEDGSDEDVYARSGRRINRA